MFSIRKILKRTLGGLKMAAAWAPIILTPAGFLTFIGTGLAWGLTGPSYDEYIASDVYQQEMIRDLDRYKESFENGDMTQEEYVNAIYNMSEKDYVKEVLARDIEGNAEWQEYMNSDNLALGIACLSGLGAGIVSGLLLIPWLGFDVKDSIEWSADDDFDWEPPKKEPKPPKKEKVVDEIKSDVSEDEEELGTTDDFILSLQ